jgi:hypothetical protein
MSVAFHSLPVDIHVKRRLAKETAALKARNFLFCQRPDLCEHLGFRYELWVK